MTNLIEELRKFVGNSDDDINEVYEEIDGLLYGKKVKRVASTFEEGGRWMNYETQIYEVTDEGETAYFEMGRDVNASESQDGQENSWSFDEVEPKEVTVIKYVSKGSR